jgi:hypothetical protein
LAGGDGLFVGSRASTTLVRKEPMAQFEHGFQKEELYFKGLSAQEHAEELARKLGRKDFGLSLFSTLNELNVSEG